MCAVCAAHNKKNMPKSACARHMRSQLPLGPIFLGFVLLTRFHWQNVCSKKMDTETGTINCGRVTHCKNMNHLHIVLRAPANEHTATINTHINHTTFLSIHRHSIFNSNYVSNPKNLPTLCFETICVCFFFFFISFGLVVLYIISWNSEPKYEFWTHVKIECTSSKNICRSVIKGKMKRRKEKKWKKKKKTF